MKTAIFILMIVLLSGPPVTAEKAPSIRKLDPSDFLTVIFSSTGCFHNYTDTLVFTGKQASIFTMEPNKSKDGGGITENQKKLLGVVNLNDADITKLDALFEFYADAPDRGCTTIDRINVTLSRNDKVIQTCEFTDSTCGTDDMDSVMTFRALKKKLKKQANGGVVE